MWYVFLILLLADIALLVYLVRQVSESTLGPHASRLVAVLLAAYAFYFPAKLIASAPYVTGRIGIIHNRWIEWGVAATFVAAIAYIVFQAWKNRHAEFGSILKSGLKFALIGVLAIGARVLLSVVLK